MIRSIQGTSLIEYPGKISAVLFSAGCNLACPFCHNPDLVNVDLLDGEYSLNHTDVLRELGERQGFIDAVVLTGGEPLLYPENIDLLRRIKEETLLSVKLDTNGTFPERLEAALEFTDFVAMDLKSSPDKYIAATGGRAVFGNVRRSGKLLMSQNSCQYEFRSTMVPGIIDEDDVLTLLREFSPGKIKRYALQRFRSENTLSPELRNLSAYPSGYLEGIAAKMTERVENIQLRI